MVEKLNLQISNKQLVDWIHKQTCSFTVTQTDQRIVTHCLLGGPLNSSLIRCSKIQTTMPTKRKQQAVTAHISRLKGRRKAQAPELSFLKGATTTSPDAAYGCVKSTIFVRFVTMAISPTTPSKFCRVINSTVRKTVKKKQLFLDRKKKGFI